MYSGVFAGTAFALLPPAAQAKKLILGEFGSA
jgi:hypothetical protein